MTTVLVRNAERMMMSASVADSGIRCVFTDGARGDIPFVDLPEIEDADVVAGLELPNAYELIVTLLDGQQVEIPWDFALITAINRMRQQSRPSLRQPGHPWRTDSPEQGVGRADAGGTRSGGRDRSSDVGAFGERRPNTQIRHLHAIAKALEIDVNALLVEP